ERTADIIPATEKRALLHLELMLRGYYMARRGYVTLSLPLGEAEYDGFVAAMAGVIDEDGGVLSDSLSGVRNNEIITGKPVIARSEATKQSSVSGTWLLLDRFATLATTAADEWRSHLKGSHLRKYLLPVFPAKAGTEGKRRALQSWIPAFAGITVKI